MLRLGVHRRSGPGNTCAVGPNSLAPLCLDQSLQRCVDMDLWSLPPSVIAFLSAAALTVYGGTRLAGTGDELADRTGLGEAVFGAFWSVA